MCVYCGCVRVAGRCICNWRRYEHWRPPRSFASSTPIAGTTCRSSAKIRTPTTVSSTRSTRWRRPRTAAAAATPAETEPPLTGASRTTSVCLDARRETRWTDSSWRCSRTSPVLSSYTPGELARTSWAGLMAWLRGVMATALVVSTKLLYVEPG